MKIAIRQLVLVSLLAGGCGAQVPTEGEPTPAATDNHLLASVAMAGGNVFEFYEPAPGHIMISELGRVGSKPLMPEYHLARLSAVDAFRALAPAAPVPAELVAAAQRAELLPKPTRTSAPPASFATTAPRVTPRALSSTALWFQTNLCATPGISPNRTWCLLDWWNGAWEGGNGKWTYAAVYADTGDIILSYEGDYSAIFTVGQGYYRTFEAKGTFFGTVSETYRVLNAADKRFDFAGYFEGEWFN
jgi:hypothetical protein